MKPIMTKTPFTDETISALCNTIVKNKDEILALLNKNRTKSLNLSFSFIPGEIVTMDIFASKLVESEDEQLFCVPTEENKNM